MAKASVKKTFTQAEVNVLVAEAGKRAAPVLDPAFAGLKHHICTVTGGRKENLPHGAQVEVVHVGLSRRFGYAPYASVLVDGERAFINPAFLKKGKPMSDVRIAELETDNDGVIRVRGEARDISEKAVSFQPKGLFSRVVIAKSNITEVRTAKNEATDVYEMPAWALRQKLGEKNMAVLMADAEALAAIDA